MMLEAGVDAKLKEEGVELSKGEEVDDVCSSKSRGGRYGLCGVSMCANEKRWVGGCSTGSDQVGFCSWGRQNSVVFEKESLCLA